MDGEFSTVSAPELVSEITTLVGHLNAANGRLLALIAELDRRRGWAEWGVKSTSRKWGSASRCPRAACT